VPLLSAVPDRGIPSLAGHGQPDWGIAPGILGITVV
jgi:hypothetical protein